MDKITILQKMVEIYTKILKLMQIQLSEKLANKRQVIFETAKGCLGKIMAPIYKEWGCAEAVNNIVKMAIGREIGGGPSTYRMYLILKDSKEWQRVTDSMPGDLIISPTGFGTGKISGHVGIVSDDQKIISNNSETLKLDEHYDLRSWDARYKVVGGFPVYFYRIV